jgi:hypothetical protein
MQGFEELSGEAVKNKIQKKKRLGFVLRIYSSRYGIRDMHYVK